MTITLPFAALVSDNARHGLVGRMIRLTREYRHALEVVAMLARGQWRRPPLDGPVSVVVRCHFPDRRRRDVLNYAKLLGDGLSGVCWHDDVQLADVRFVRGAIDADKPRLELTITPTEQP